MGEDSTQVRGALTMKRLWFAFACSLSFAAQAASTLSGDLSRRDDRPLEQIPGLDSRYGVLRAARRSGCRGPGFPPAGDRPARQVAGQRGLGLGAERQAAGEREPESFIGSSSYLRRVPRHSSARLLLLAGKSGRSGRCRLRPAFEPISRDDWSPDLVAELGRRHAHARLEGAIEGADRAITDAERDR